MKKRLDEGVELTPDLRPVNETLSYKIAEMLPVLAVADLILISAYFGFKWRSHLEQSPAVNLFGGVVAMVVILVGLALSLIWAFFTGSMEIAESLIELLPFGTEELRSVLGLVPFTYLAIYYVVRVLERAYITYRVKFVLALALIFLAAVFITKGISLL
jgi:hypothetical protein